MVERGIVERRSDERREECAIEVNAQPQFAAAVIVRKTRIERIDPMIACMVTK
jgi:hypothetical protein